MEITAGKLIALGVGVAEMVVVAAMGAMREHGVDVGIAVEGLGWC